MSHSVFQIFRTMAHTDISLKVEFNGKMKDYYKMWIERCEDLKTQDLAADWDGVFRATSK